MSRYRDVLLFFLLAGLWGGSFVAIEVGLAYYPPVLYAAYRFDIAALVLVTYVLLTESAPLPRTHGDAAAIGLSGGLNVAINNSLLFAGQQYIGVQASVTLGELRSMRVFVLGEARNAGSYTVSSLSTITNALYVSGGIKRTGSLRKIQHKRDGNLVGELDLYDLLLAGDTSDDSRLQPGDVIFIPPVGDRVGIDGEVYRPALYELKNDTNLQELVNLAGGLTPQAYPQLVRIERNNDDFLRIIAGGDQQENGAA